MTSEVPTRMLNNNKIIIIIIMMMLLMMMIIIVINASFAQLDVQKMNGFILVPIRKLPRATITNVKYIIT